MMRHEATGPSWQGIGEWVLGIVGGIAAVLGLFILFAGEEQYVGIGGDLSWRVGDIPAAWSYGLLIGGGVLVLLALGLLLFAPRSRGAQLGASRGRDLLLHALVFVLVNAFLWVQDFAIGGGIDYAYWVTIPWGIGLAAHALSVYMSGARQQPPRDVQPR